MERIWRMAGRVFRWMTGRVSVLLQAGLTRATLESSWVAAFLLVVAFSLGLVQGVCQSEATARRSSDVSVFLEGAVVETGYAGTTQPGFALGADYTRYFRRLSLAPSLEGRASYTPVLSVVGERVYSGGLRIESTHFIRFRPYGDFLAGAGKVRFDTPPETSDRSIVYTYGGGVDFDVSPHLSVKVDAQGSRWRLNPAETRYPAIVGVGLVYRLRLGQRFTR